MRLRRQHIILTALGIAGVLALACTPAGDRTRFEEATPPPMSTTSTAAVAVPKEKPAEPVVWQQLGEPGAGGRVTGLAIDPNDADRLLVGGDLIGAGLSTDGGATWEDTFGLTNGELSRFTFNPTVADEVWVGTMGGPFVSRDGGRNWQPQRVGMPAPLDIGYSAPIEEVLFDPTNAKRLLAFGGSHREWNAPGTSGWGLVWESVDAGDSWNPIATIADGTNIVDATWLADGTLLVAALGRGLFRSTDAGRTWVPADDGLPNFDVRGLAAHPTDARVVWAALGAARFNGALVAGGVWKSVDGGTTWQPSGNGLDLSPSGRTELEFAPRYHVIAVSDADPDVLLTSNLAYGAEAVFRSTDGGASWTGVIGARTINRPSTAYQTPISANALALDPFDAQRALIGNAEFVLATTDGGKRWRDITSDTFPDGTAAGRGFSGLVANRVEFSPDGSELLLCGFDGANPLLNSNREPGWSRPLVASDPWGGCIDAAYSTAAPGRRYVLLGQNGVFGGVAVLEADDSFRLVAGADSGLPERYSNVGPLGALELVTVNGVEVVAVAAGGVLYVSNDGGASFNVADTTLGANELAADDAQPGRLYIAGSGGVSYSDNGGQGFATIANSPKAAVRLTLDGATGRLYAAVWRTAGAGLWRFDGNSFTQILSERTAHDVAVDPTDPDHLLAASNDHPYHDVISSLGVLQSTDGGATWQPLNSGLPMLRVATVAFDPAQRGRAVIGTFGRGFYVADNAL